MEIAPLLSRAVDGALTPADDVAVKALWKRAPPMREVNAAPPPAWEAALEAQHARLAELDAASLHDVTQALFEAMHDPLAAHLALGDECVRGVLSEGEWRALRDAWQRAIEKPLPPAQWRPPGADCADGAGDSDAEECGAAPAGAQRDAAGGGGSGQEEAADNTDGQALFTI